MEFLPDIASWISATSTLSTSAANRITRLVTTLDQHPDIAAAYHCGDINADDARLITSFLENHLPACPTTPATT